MDAITSLVVERAADADRDGLLPDRDVEEPRELAGAEALLDLLLEAPDEEHLAEERHDIPRGCRVPCAAFATSWSSYRTHSGRTTRAEAGPRDSNWRP